MSTENTKNVYHNKENGLLKTGEFARLANINRDTFAFYIKKRLIQPVYVGKNKYKYFAPEQVQTISLIKYLRRCQMPIRSIRDILQNPSYENIQTHIADQRKYLEEQQSIMREASAFIKDYKREKDVLDSNEPEVPFLQYCRPQRVTAFPIRFCQPFNEIRDLSGISSYLNSMSRHMIFYPSVCLIPSDTLSCTEFCRSAGHCHVIPQSDAADSHDYHIDLEEGLYAMIVGRSRNEKMDANLSLLREKAASMGYEPSEKFIYLFIESSLLKIPDSAGKRYLMKMKIRKKEA